MGLAEDGLPVLGSYRIPIIVASSDYDNGLISLAQTVVATATHFNRANLNLIVITENLGMWQNRARSIVPAQASAFIQLLQNWRPMENQRLLIVFDGYSQRWGLSSRVLFDLASMPVLNLFITARPSDALELQSNLPAEVDMLLPDRRGMTRSAFCKMILGHINDNRTKNALAHLTPLTTKLEYGQFALRHKSRWLIFTTATV